MNTPAKPLRIHLPPITPPPPMTTARERVDALWPHVRRLASLLGVTKPLVDDVVPCAISPKRGYMKGARWLVTACDGIARTEFWGPCPESALAGFETILVRRIHELEQELLAHESNVRHSVIAERRRATAKVRELRLRAVDIGLHREAEMEAIGALRRTPFLVTYRMRDEARQRARVLAINAEDARRMFEASHPEATETHATEDTSTQEGTTP